MNHSKKGFSSSMHGGGAFLFLSLIVLDSPGVQRRRGGFDAYALRGRAGEHGSLAGAIFRLQ